MSRENVEQLRLGFELWNVALNEPDEATWRAITVELSNAYHPEAQIDFSRTVPDFPNVSPRDAMTEWVEDTRGTFTEVRVEPTEFIDAGDVVLTVMRISGKGTLSGATIAADFTYVFRYRDGQIIAATTYQTRQDALEAEGLTE
jgi:ketosteroid isomerase-like protein